MSGNEKHLYVPDSNKKNSNKPNIDFKDHQVINAFAGDEEVNHEPFTIEQQKILNARRSSLAAAEKANKRISESLKRLDKSGGSLSNDSYDGSSLEIEDNYSANQYPLPESKKDISGKIIQLSLIMLALLTIVFLSIYFVVNELKPTIVHTNQGIVEGIIITKLDRPVFAFFGIPYAKPPVGNLRFRKPQPLDRWPNKLQAFKKAKSCAQFTNSYSIAKFNENYSEDCLYLNIWVPYTIKSNLAKDKKPVLVWLHSGVFIMGSPNTIDGSILASFGDVIVVTIGFRLGVFGFSYSGTSNQLEKKWSQGIPGNLGLHDQVLALRWIKANIAHFGGDPFKITLFGDSAGSVSAGYHLLSPISRDLFKRVILQSGSPIVPITLIGSETGPIKLEMLLNITNCPYLPRKNESNRYVTFTDFSFKCLRELSVEKLLMAQAKIIMRWKDLGFTPVVDKDFFNEHPYDTLDNSDFHGNQKELMMGTNSNDGALFLTGAMPDLFPLRSKLPSYLSYDLVLSRFKKFKLFETDLELTLLNNSLFSSTNTNKNNAQQVANHVEKLASETIFLCPDMSMVNSFTRKADTKVYYYRFMPKASSRKKIAVWAKGALHSEEIQFIFGQPLINSNEYTKDEINLSKDMMRYWSNFAHFGNPINENNNISGNNWSPCINDDRYYMELNLNGSKLIKGEPENQCGMFFDDFYNYIRFKFNYYRY